MCARQRCSTCLGEHDTCCAGLVCIRMSMIYVTPVSFFLRCCTRIHFSSMLLCCLLRTFRCMFAVILVTHKNMMTISGNHIQGLHSTPVRHHTQIDLLTCRVCFVKHMMITTQVRHHTHLDLSTCHVGSVKQGRAATEDFSRRAPTGSDQNSTERVGDCLWSYQRGLPSDISM